ncbi:MAG: phosphoglucosamine mutase [Bacteriovoracaceae bacterium]|nr:phosphoglucosamine mutase [Bacteriovoracaceae bacterium]
MSGKRNLFGTDGIRGKANIHPMTGEVAMALGRAVTYYFQKNSNKKPLIIIGKDTRLSCYMLEQAFSAGVCSQGGRAIFTGPLPTPGVAFVTQSMRADAGVMISASHNPYEDNGIKIFDRSGHKLPDDVELELEKMILNPSLIPAKVGGELGNAKRLDEVIGRYIVHAKSAFNSSYSLEGLRIVVDGANGAAYKLAPQVFEELGAEVISLGKEPNGININRGCGALHPQMCAEHVVKFRADIGVCVDGDADRVVLIDRDGTVIDGDKVIGLCARFLKDSNQLDGQNEIVGTVMSNFGLEVYLKKHGLSLNRTQVGDRYIVERMRHSGSVFGGEPSGHLIFKKHSTTGDGILAALKVIECMKFYKKGLKELADEVVLYPQVLLNTTTSKKPPFEDVPAIAQAVKEAEAELKGSGRLLLRYSGTENLARVMVEGQDAELVEKLCRQLTDIVAKQLG